MIGILRGQNLVVPNTIYELITNDGSLNTIKISLGVRTFESLFTQQNETIREMAKRINFILVCLGKRDLEQLLTFSGNNNINCGIVNSDLMIGILRGHSIIVPNTIYELIIDYGNLEKLKSDLGGKSFESFFQGHNETITLMARRITIILSCLEVIRFRERRNVDELLLLPLNELKNACKLTATINMTSTELNTQYIKDVRERLKDQQFDNSSNQSIDILDLNKQMGFGYKKKIFKI